MANRVERMRRILALLCDCRPYNAVQISAECQVHRRTVFRDIAALRNLGFELLFDVDSACYSLETYEGRDWNSIPESEIILLLMAACLRMEDSLPNASAIRKSARQYAACLPESAQERLKHLTDSLDGASEHQFPPWAPVVVQMIRDGAALTVCFLKKLNHKVSQPAVTIVPLSLTVNATHWILRGGCEHQREINFEFASARIEFSSDTDTKDANPKTPNGIVLTIQEPEIPP